MQIIQRYATYRAFGLKKKASENCLKNEKDYASVLELRDEKRNSMNASFVR